jgi:hypothetical protein
MRAKLLQVEKIVLTAKSSVTKLRLESRLLGIMKAKNMQARETAKLAIRERGEDVDGK